MTDFIESGTGFTITGIDGISDRVKPLGCIRTVHHNPEVIGADDDRESSAAVRFLLACVHDEVPEHSLCTAYEDGLPACPLNIPRERVVQAVDPAK